ncbi:MAG: hypothetical protein WBC92_03690, partial [Terracidiphilus sp.]
SPYVHRASGLAQIAVSTLLRASSTGNRKFLHAEHCRYGTRDLATTDTGSGMPAIPAGPCRPSSNETFAGAPSGIGGAIVKVT